MFLYKVLQRLSNVCHVVRFVDFNDAARDAIAFYEPVSCFATCSPSSSSATQTKVAHETMIY